DPNNDTCVIIFDLLRRHLERARHTWEQAKEKREYEAKILRLHKEYVRRQDNLNHLKITDVIFDVMQLPQSRITEPALELGIELAFKAN
ncbi:unnamed protein product, partial [Discosporangium mesarthrocarpum]